ncbi:superoxide dismutase [Nocardioides humi]|uniref:ANTAR domain-containing protein n=1 Tax=Nocardioides humi TaxID=449461 RepID=A0ABN2BPT3_9ACTN|nr:superoxide dismutase [Nocardioides humi]
MSGDERRTQLAPVVAAAQRVAGIVAARGRGDAEGARELLLSFDDDRELAGGALLVAELSLGLLRRETGESLDACVRDLCVEMETALR